MNRTIMESIRPWVKDNIVGQSIDEVRFIEGSTQAIVTLQNGVMITVEIIGVMQDDT